MTNLHLTPRLLACVLVVGVPGVTQAAKLYKWVDDNGQVHYSESIPPQYREKANTEMDRRGRVVRNNEAIAEQKRRAQEEGVRQQAEQQRLGEQARRDKALLDTYTNEAEIDLARDRNLALPQQAVESYEPRIKTARRRGDALRAQRDSLAKAGKPVSEALLADIAASEKDVVGLLAEQKAKQSEIERINEKFAAQKARYRELTVGSPEGSAKNP